MSHKVTKSQRHRNYYFRLVTLCLGVLVTIGVTAVYALGLDSLKSSLMAGDYKAAIVEGEKIIAASGDEEGLDELYYILGLCYLKDGNYLRASDIFEIIIKEFSSGSYLPQASLGLVDTYFFRGDFQKAKDGCLRLLADKKATDLKASVYYRLSQCEAKLGNTAAAKDYISRLSQEFPANVESGWESCPLISRDFYYSVQVGSFLSRANADNLARQLERKGYPAYVEEGVSQGTAVYRVRSGKLSSRQEAVGLESKLSREGYPTKICP